LDQLPQLRPGGRPEHDRPPEQRVVHRHDVRRAAPPGDGHPADLPGAEELEAGVLVELLHDGLRSHRLPHFTIMAVTMPNIPLSDSAWVRMWQCQAHTPGVSAWTRTV